jgi:hypothetical protein
VDSTDQLLGRWQVSPGCIRGEGRRHADHKLAKISPIHLIGSLVRDCKCSLVVSANYCRLVVVAGAPLCG